MNNHLHHNAAIIAHLKSVTKSRVPRFVYDFRCEDCNEDLAVRNNWLALDQIFLQPNYPAPVAKNQTSVEIPGQGYPTPFGVVQLGLSGPNGLVAIEGPWLLKNHHLQYLGLGKAK